MANKTNKDRADRSFASSETNVGQTEDIRSQMEILRRELHHLARRAEVELENNLQALPAPLLEMVRHIAHQISATAVGVWIEWQFETALHLPDAAPLLLSESDKLQCGLAVTGREMCFDFANSKVFIPVVIFENPVAIAVLEVPTLSPSNYSTLCDVVCHELKQFRAQLKNCSKRFGNTIDAAS